VCHVVRLALSVDYRQANQLYKLDRQALLKAKYCPRVAAVSCTPKTHITHVTFTFEYDLEIQ